jgi:arylsulfatase
MLAGALAPASFDREGDSRPAEGTLTLHAAEKEIGKGRIKTQPGNFFIVGEGLNVGKDGAEPVTDDYPGGAPARRAPGRFTGGTIVRAAVDVSGEPFVNLAAEAGMAFMRDQARHARLSRSPAGRPDETSGQVRNHPGWVT